MPKIIVTKSINRVIDANINRAKEGLRVCEEICRFLLNERKTTSEFKKIRHRIDTIVRRLPVSLPEFIKARDSRKDIGRDIYINELKRKNLSEVFFANIQRVKESLRVLEEFSKLIAQSPARDFKKLRYVIYEIEKRIVKRISALRNH